MKLRLFFGVGCLMVAVAGGFLLGAAPTARGPVGGELAGLKAEVVPATQSAVAGGEVNATFRITNTGEAARSFNIYSCSWSTQWKSSSASISMMTKPCGRNGITTKTLAPGEKWEGEDPLLIDGEMPAGEVTVTFTFQETSGGGSITSVPVKLMVAAAK